MSRFPSKILCLHHNDADGRASAAIVRRALGSIVKLYEISYGDAIPFGEIDQAEQVIVVDFSLPRNIMAQIGAEGKLTWIDHHISAMKEMADLAVHWPGKRDISEAACVLTWQYYFPKLPVPRPIILIGDRDIWRMAEPETRPFNEGLHQQNTRPDQVELWQKLLEGDPDLLKNLTDTGAVLLQARLMQLRRAARRYGFEVRFEGYYTLAINRPGEGELGEIVSEMGYEIGYFYTESMQNGRLTTSVMLTSRQVDVSLIAQKFGGGGHRGASGFSFERSSAQPFPYSANVEFL